MSIEFAEAAKARELRTYFSRHGRVYVVVNATGDDVQVPEHLHGDPALRLVLNVRMPQQIMIGDDTLESDLTFSGIPYHCVIPMHAIWAAYVPEQQLENGIVWEEDVPETIRTMVKAVRSMRDDVEISGEHYQPDVALAAESSDYIEQTADTDKTKQTDHTDKTKQTDHTDKTKQTDHTDKTKQTDTPVSGRKIGHLRVVK